MSPSARGLCEALARTGVTIDAPNATRLVANPRAAVTEELAALLRRFKPELIGAIRRAVRDGVDGAIAACRGCDAEFVLAAGALCPWCNAADVTGERDRSATIRNTERSGAAPRTTVLTVPEGMDTGTVGTLRDS